MKLRHQAAVAGAVLLTARDSAGRKLFGLPDGSLAFLTEDREDATEIVIVQAGPVGQCLAEAPGGSLRIDPAAKPVMILPLRTTVYGPDTLLQDVAGTQLLVSPDGMLVASTDETYDVACVSLTTSYMPEAMPGLLARLPAACAGDDALACILAAGQPYLMPVAQALLQLVDASHARTAWNAAPRGAAQDAYHSLLRDHAHQTLGHFGSYTAEILAEQVRLYDWSIGTHTYGVPLTFEAGRGSKLIIGRFCSMANPTIILGNHATRSATSYPFLDMWAEWPGTTVGLADHVMHDVRIGNDVWIGVNAILLPGTEVGDGAVIGAGCVVRGKVPPYAVCIGNPGQVSRYRFPPEIVARLLKVAWWHWPDGKIDRYIPLLLAQDISKFLEAAESEADAEAENRTVSRLQSVG